MEVEVPTDDTVEALLHAEQKLEKRQQQRHVGFVAGPLGEGLLQPRRRRHSSRARLCATVRKTP